MMRATASTMMANDNIPYVVPATALVSWEVASVMKEIASTVGKICKLIILCM